MIKYVPAENSTVTGKQMRSPGGFGKGKSLVVLDFFCILVLAVLIIEPVQLELKKSCYQTGSAFAQVMITNWTLIKSTSSYLTLHLLVC